MKLKNIFSFGLAALAVVTVSSCDRLIQPAYTEAGAVDDSRRVYFRSGTQNEILSMESTGFPVNVYRYVPETPEGEEEILMPDLSVAVSATCSVEGIIGGSDAAISISSTAEFRDGLPFAPLTAVINDPAKLEGNKPYVINFEIDPEYANQYAITSMTLTVTREEYTDWALFGYDEAQGRDGEGVYTYAQCFTGNEDPTRVLERHVPSNPDAMELEFQWLIDNDNPDLGWETFLKASTLDGGKNITVPEQLFIDYPGYGEIYVCDLATYTGTSNYAPSTFDPETGLFSLDVVYWCSSQLFGYGFEYCQMKGYKDTNEYTVRLTDQGQVNVGGNDYSVINFYLSKHVDYVDYTLLDGELTDEEVAEVAAMLQEEEQTVYQVSTLQNPAPGKEPYSANVTFNFEVSGDYTIVAVGYHADATGKTEAKTVESLHFGFTTFNPYAGWVDFKAGAAYRDGFVAGILGLFGEEGQLEDIEGVQVDQYEEYPSVYRITNPYLDSMQAPAYFDIKSFGSIEYQVLESGNVVFPLSGTGILNGPNEFSVMSMAYYYMATGDDEAEVPAKLFGKFDESGNVLTLDALADDDEDGASFVLEYQGGLYYCNVPFTLALDGSLPALGQPAEKAAFKKAALKAVSSGRKIGTVKDLTLPALYKVGTRKAVKAAAEHKPVVRKSRRGLHS